MSEHVNQSNSFCRYRYVISSTCFTGIAFSLDPQ